MLDLVGQILRENTISFVRFDGSISRKKRDRAVESFQDSSIDSPRVFLASLKSACFGINLTAANKVILLDSWWNGSVEDQAVDRIFRLGQTREVSIVRFMIRGSVEVLSHHSSKERVAEIQAQKRRLAAEAFGEKKMLAGRESRLCDLKDLFSITMKVQANRSQVIEGDSRPLQQTVEQTQASSSRSQSSPVKRKRSSSNSSANSI